MTPWVSLGIHTISLRLQNFDNSSAIVFWLLGMCKMLTDSNRDFNVSIVWWYGIKFPDLTCKSSATCLQTNCEHYNKTRLLQLGFPTHTSEKTKTLLTWKTTSRFRQAVKSCRTRHSQWICSQWQWSWGCSACFTHKVMSYFTMCWQYK